MGGIMSDKSKQRTETRQNQATRIDPIWQDRGDQAWNRAEHAAQLGFQPNRGVRVAGFTPMEQAAMHNIYGAANAFGMANPAGGPMAGMPTAVDNGMGIFGYGTGGAYDNMRDSLPPGYRQAIDDLFIDPETGAGPVNDFTAKKREELQQGGGPTGPTQGIFKPSSELGFLFDTAKRGLSGAFGFDDPGANVYMDGNGGYIEDTGMTTGPGYTPCSFGG